jgi:peptide/nickel transport system substrate-binding protein
MHERKQKKGAVLVALLLVLSLFAAACGGSDDDGSDAADKDGTSTSDVDTEGILKLGISLNNPGGNHFDPTVTQSTVDLQWMQLVFGTLLRARGDGSIEPFMAKSYELVDPQTVTLELREGVKFTDGSAYDAETVKAGLLRTLNQAQAASKSSQNIGFAEISEIIVDGPLALTIKTKTPVAGTLVAGLADREGVVPSPAQVAAAPGDIETKPIGAGPYTLVKNDNLRLLSFRRNPDFFDVDKWRLGGIDIIDAPDGSAKVNGIKTSTLDMATRLFETDAAALDGDDTYSLSSTFNERSEFYVNFCRSKAPFDDVKKRNAVLVGIDREQINKLVFNGRGQAAHGMWPKGHAYENADSAASLEYTEAKAKAAAEAAGPFEFELHFPAGSSPEYARIVEAMQAQLAKNDITLKIVPSQDLLNNFIKPQKAGAMMVPQSRSGVNKYFGPFQAGATTALCGTSVPEIIDTISPASAEAPGSEKSAGLFQEVEAKIVDEALLVPIVRGPVINAWTNERVGGKPEFDTNQSYLLFDSLYIKK